MIIEFPVRRAEKKERIRYLMSLRKAAMAGEPMPELTTVGMDGVALPLVRTHKQWLKAIETEIIRVCRGE